jgi:hypothetical protein
MSEDRPVVKGKLASSVTMLQFPPGAGWPKKSTVASRWKEPLPVDKLLVAFPSSVMCANEHKSFRQLNDVN